MPRCVLRERRIVATFVDVRKRPIAPDELRPFIDRLGAAALLDVESRAYRDAGLALTLGRGGNRGADPRRPAPPAAPPGPLRRDGHGRPGRGDLERLAGSPEVGRCRRDRRRSVGGQGSGCVGWIPRTRSRTAEATRSGLSPRPRSPAWCPARTASRGGRPAASRGSMSARTRPSRCSAAR